MSDKLSVLIPVLNAGPFIHAAMESLEQQTYKNFEVLVWDNGSTDNTLAILKRWLPGRLSGHVYCGDPLSLGDSLKRLVEVAEDELCVRMDADDVCHADRFEKQVECLRRHPELAVIGTDRDCIDMNGKKVEAKSDLPHGSSDVLHATLNGVSLWHPTVLFRRSCILEVGNYQDSSCSEAPYWSEDYDLWMRLQSKYLAAAMPDRLLHYRINPSGVTQTAMREKRTALSRRRVWERHSGAFTGLPVASAMRLHNKTSHFALPLLWRVASNFTRLDGMSAANRMTYPSYVHAMSKLISKRDFATRLWIKASRSITARSFRSTPEGDLPKL
jgi:glycosyltransferase involved in cell wall biosynthesis